MLPPFQVAPSPIQRPWTFPALYPCIPGQVSHSPHSHKIWDFRVTKAAFVSQIPLQTGPDSSGIRSRGCISQRMGTLRRDNPGKSSGMSRGTQGGPGGSSCPCPGNPRRHSHAPAGIIPLIPKNRSGLFLGARRPNNNCGAQGHPRLSPAPPCAQLRSRFPPSRGRQLPQIQRGLAGIFSAGVGRAARPGSAPPWGLLAFPSPLERFGSRDIGWSRVRSQRECPSEIREQGWAPSQGCAQERAFPGVWGLSRCNELGICGISTQDQVFGVFLGFF